MCPRPPPSSAYCVRAVIFCGPETSYKDLNTYVTDTVEKGRNDIRVKIGDFGIKRRDWTEIGQKNVGKK